MRRVIAMLAAIALLSSAGAAGTQARAAGSDRVRACFQYPHDGGCVTVVAVQIGWHVNLRARADWHAGKRVELWQSDPGETAFELAARLRFDENGRVLWRWDAPTEMECCWRWVFRAVNGRGDVLAVSNRLRAETAPGD